MTIGGRAYSTATSTRIKELPQLWQIAQFNVFGMGNYSSVNFNNGAALTISTKIDNGTANTPDCSEEVGTGESNRLYYNSPCCRYGGGKPSIAFVEGTDSNPNKFTCADLGNNTITPEVTPAGSGTITPSVALEVPNRAVSTFRVTPSDSKYYKIGSVTGCGGSLSGNVFTTAPATGDCTVTAAFVPQTYTVTGYAYSGGTISPSATVDAGTTYTFTVTPSAGYYIASISGCNGTAFTGNSASTTASSYTTGAVTGNCTVSATFTALPVTITASVNGEGGTISPSGDISGVVRGTTRAFTVTPSAGYYIASISGCGGAILTGNSAYITARSYTTGAITAACTVSASFAALPPLTITASAGTGGTISPAGAIADVASGTTRTFTVTPNANYYIYSISGCGGTAVTGNTTFTAARTYTTGTVTANCTVSASFYALPAYTITASAGTGGTISPAGTTTGVVLGTNRTFTVTPSAGYYIASISGCNGTAFTGNSANTTASAYTTGAVTGNCTVSATFTALPITITASVNGEGGTISPSGDISGVVRGTTRTFTVTPSAGYYIASISGCGGATLTGNSAYITARSYTTGAITAACTVSASFATLPPLTITASAGTGGTISPAGAIADVTSGTTRTFTVTPNANYYIYAISGCGGTTVTGNTTFTAARSYTTGAITANCTVSASFYPLPAYTITASAGTGGTISPAGTVTGVVLGTNRTFTVTPSAGYYINQIYGCNGATVTGNSTFTTASAYTTGAVNSNCAVSATFAALPITITASAGAGGAISPAGDISGVVRGTARTFTVTPSAGYYIASISGCGGATLTGNSAYITARSYTTGAITAACTVSASFATLPPLTITASAGTGGTISPAGAVTDVTSGTTRTFTVTPNANYYIYSISGCGGTAVTGNTTFTATRSYTTGAVTANCTVSASFYALPTYVITASAGTGGTISPAGTVTGVVLGTNRTFTVTPSAGYYINQIYGCNGTVFTGNSVNTTASTYTTGAVTSACIVTATFTALPVTITASASTGGAISPSGDISGVVRGTARTFTVTPSAGYYIASISGCGGAAVTGNSAYITARSYTTGAITAACTVSASFATLPPLTITASAGTGGTISPAGAIADVASGTTRTFTVTPNANYYIYAISGCGGTTIYGNTTSTAARSYTTGAVTANCTVSASFYALPTYAITASAGTGGTISPTGTTTGVVLGTTRTFTVTPGVGRYIASISGCGGATVTGNSTFTTAIAYTTGAITGNCSVYATFGTGVASYTVSTNISGGGTISPASVTVNSGATQTFTVTPDEGYVIVSISGCDGTAFIGAITSTAARTYTTTST